ncbi:hypothetical protein K8R14_03925 [bacterium]|nr:hypothetical protein [bacterium]
MKNKSIIKKVLISLIIIFILILAFFLLQSFDINLFPVAAVLGVLFLILGIYLTILSRKETEKLKTYLMITGISAITPLISVILHNFFYGLGIAFPNLSGIFEILHVGFFLLALIVAPLLFLMGITASMIKIYKRK